MHSESQLETREVGQQMMMRLAMGLPPSCSCPFCSSVHSSEMPCSVFLQRRTALKPLHPSSSLLSFCRRCEHMHARRQDPRNSLCGAKVCRNSAHLSWWQRREQGEPPHSSPQAHIISQDAALALKLPQAGHALEHEGDALALVRPQPLG